MHFIIHFLNVFVYLFYIYCYHKVLRNPNVIEWSRRQVCSLWRQCFSCSPEHVTEQRVRYFPEPEDDSSESGSDKIIVASSSLLGRRDWGRDVPLPPPVCHFEVLQCGLGLLVRAREPGNHTGGDCAACTVKVIKGFCSRWITFTLQPGAS